MPSEDSIRSIIANAVGAGAIHRLESVQSLWGGYGSIDRYALEGSSIHQVIVKRIAPPRVRNHPRGWGTDLGHQRKLRSYQVETNWYRTWAQLCEGFCRIPTCYAIHQEDDGIILVMEDLDHAGYARRLSSADLATIELGLEWLARFHMRFLNHQPEGLWPTGTYWHLATRPEELAVLDHLELKNAAQDIDELLNTCPYQTIVHGDAKLANFCFSENLEKVAAVDFQYVGGGVGVKDVAYFIGSCLDEKACERHADQLLDRYFIFLKDAYDQGFSKERIDFSDLEHQWRILFPVAWTDFHRFLKGWSPGHWKINSYSERVCREVLAHIGQ